jgi:hypothetical protein
MVGTVGQIEHAASAPGSGLGGAASAQHFSDEDYVAYARMYCGAYTADYRLKVGLLAVK